MLTFKLVVIYAEHILNFNKLNLVKLGYGCLVLGSRPFMLLFTSCLKNFAPFKWDQMWLKNIILFVWIQENLYQSFNLDYQILLPIKQTWGKFKSDIQFDAQNFEKWLEMYWNCLLLWNIEIKRKSRKLIASSWGPHFCFNMLKS